MTVQNSDKSETRESIRMTLLVMTIFGAFAISLAIGFAVDGENMIWSGVAMTVASIAFAAIGAGAMHVAVQKHVQHSEGVEHV